MLVGGNKHLENLSQAEETTDLEFQAFLFFFFFFELIHVPVPTVCASDLTVSSRYQHSHSSKDPEAFTQVICATLNRSVKL